MSSFNGKAEAWVRAKFPGSDPKPGTVEFEIAPGYDERDYLEVSMDEQNRADGALGRREGRGARGHD